MMFFAVGEEGFDGCGVAGSDVCHVGVERRAGARYELEE